MYKRFTEKRNGKNAIPLLNSVCGVDLPKWTIAEESDIRRYLSGDAVDKLAELEDKIERGELVENTVMTYVNMARTDSKTLIDKALKFEELKAKIENGTLIDTTEKFIEEEKIKDKTRYLICEHYLTKMIVDFANTKAEAEQKLKELKNEKLF